MKRVFGIETEFGITVDGVENVDVVSESIELVRRYTEHGNLMKWDYSLEDPHQDARGESFRATELLQDTDESAYFEIDKNRPLSFEEIKSDLVLSNGARFYNDHAHPEYSTPECASLLDLVTHDGCQTNALVGYFGEERTESCGHCTFCTTGIAAALPPAIPQPPLPAGVDVPMLHALRAGHPAALGDPRQAARLLCGLSSPALTREKLTRHPLFGALEDRRFADVFAWLRAPSAP